MPKKQPAVNIAANLVAVLVERGCHLFDDVDFNVDGSHEISNALMHFAVESDLNYNQFMRVDNARDVARLGLALREPGNSGATLACAKNLQIMLYVLGEEIAGLTKGEPLPFRPPHQAASLSPAEELKRPPQPF